MEFIAGFHPRVVHFAIAFLTVYPLIELLGVIFNKDFLSKAAHLFLLFGVLGALAAVLTGNQAENVASLWEEKGAIIPFGALNDHKDYANLTLWFFTILLIFRTVLSIKRRFQGTFKIVVVVLSLIGLFLIYQVGEYGGRLVYKHGVGTELKKAEIEE